MRERERAVEERRKGAARVRGYYAFLVLALCLPRGRWILTGNLPDGKNIYPSVVIRNECALPRRTLCALSCLNILRHTNPVVVILVVIVVVVVVVVGAFGEFPWTRKKGGLVARDVDQSLISLHLYYTRFHFAVTTSAAMS